jgi:hypothetical protein
MVKGALSPVPAIVVPTSSKLLNVGKGLRDGWVENGHTNAMVAIWSEFKTMLDQARELVVIGYSLPGTDAASVELLKHFASGATPNGLKRVFLVEPTTTIEQRYTTLTGINSKIVCRDFADFNPESL